MVVKKANRVPDPGRRAVLKIPIIFFTKRAIKPLLIATNVLLACTPKTEKPPKITAPEIPDKSNFVPIEIVYRGTRVPGSVPILWDDKESRVYLDRVFGGGFLEQVREQAKREGRFVSRSALILEPQQAPEQIECNYFYEEFLSSENLADRGLRIEQLTDIHLHVLKRAFGEGGIFEKVNPENPLRIVLVPGDRVAAVFLPPQKYEYVWKREGWPIENRQALMNPSLTKEAVDIVEQLKKDVLFYHERLISFIKRAEREDPQKARSLFASDEFVKAYFKYLSSLAVYYSFANFSEADWFSYLSGALILGSYHAPQKELGIKEGLILLPVYPLLKKKVIVALASPWSELIIFVSDLLPMRARSYSLGIEYSPSVVNPANLKIQEEDERGYRVHAYLPLQFVAHHEFAHHILGPLPRKDTGIRREYEAKADTIALDQLIQAHQRWQKGMPLAQAFSIVFEDTRRERCIFAKGLEDSGKRS